VCRPLFCRCSASVLPLFCHFHTSLALLVLFEDAPPPPLPPPPPPPLLPLRRPPAAAARDAPTRVHTRHTHRPVLCACAVHAQFLFALQPRLPFVAVRDARPEK